MTIASDALTTAEYLLYYNPFGLVAVLDVLDRHGYSRLSINDVIYMLAQGKCPPRFTAWFTPRQKEYRGRYPWKYQPEYAQTADWDLETLEDYLYDLQVGLRPETELELYFFLHVTDWGYKDNPVFLLMQKEVDRLVEVGFSWEKRQEIVDMLVDCACHHFDRYMTLDTEWAMADKKKSRLEVQVPSEHWSVVDDIINPHKFPLLVMVCDRAKHPIADLNDLWQARDEEEKLPGFIKNPYDLQRDLKTDHYGLMWIVPEYIETPHYDLLGMIERIREEGIKKWDHICFLVHLSNYGCVGNPVIEALEKLKRAVTYRESTGGKRPISDRFTYLIGIIRNMKSFRIVAPRAPKS